MRFYCSNQQIEHLRGSHQNSSFELSTLFGSFHCAVGSASSGSQRFRRSWSCHQPLPRGPGFYSASVLSLPSHFKPLQKSIFSHFVKIAVLRFQVVQPAKHCKSPRPIGWRECYCCSLRYIEHWVPVMQVWSSHVPSGVRFAKASGKKM